MCALCENGCYCIVGDDGLFGVVDGVGLVSITEQVQNVRARQAEAFSSRGSLFQTQTLRF